MSGSRQEPTLTKRETEVLSQLAKGKKSREIGRELFISEKTVETHCGNLKKKLGLSSINQLIVFAVRRVERQGSYQIEERALDGKTVVKYRIKKIGENDDL